MAIQIIDDITGAIIAPSDHHKYSFIIAEGANAGKMVTLDLAGTSYAQLLTKAEADVRADEDAFTKARNILGTKRARPRQYINLELIDKLEQSGGKRVRVARAMRESNLHWLSRQAEELGISLRYNVVGYISSERSKNRLIDLWAEMETV